MCFCLYLPTADVWQSYQHPVAVAKINIEVKSMINTIIIFDKAIHPRLSCLLGRLAFFRSCSGEVLEQGVQRRFFCLIKETTSFKDAGVYDGGAAEDRTRDLLNVSHGNKTIKSASSSPFVSCMLVVLRYLYFTNSFFKLLYFQVRIFVGRKSVVSMADNFLYMQGIHLGPSHQASECVPAGMGCKLPYF